MAARPRPVVVRGVRAVLRDARGVQTGVRGGVALARGAHAGDASRGRTRRERVDVAGGVT